MRWNTGVMKQRSQPAPAPITILVCAREGEDGGLLAEWLYDVAARCGHSAQTTAVPGARRAGSPAYHVEICSRPDAALAGRRPVFSLDPVPGAIDLLVSSDLLETTRQIGLGMAASDRTTILTASARAFAVTDRALSGHRRVADEVLIATVRRHARVAAFIDAAALARAAETGLSAVLFGAIAALGVLPFPRAAYEATIRASGRGVDASLRGFSLAWATVARHRGSGTPAATSRSAAVPGPTAAAQPQPVAAPAAAVPRLPEALLAAFPPAVHDVLALGYARLVEYLDDAYAQCYAQRLERVLAAERAGDRAAEGGFAITREVARWLAVWMAYDDIARVAELKLRARTPRADGSADAEPAPADDPFPLGVLELSSLLPAGLAARLVAWDARRRLRGRKPVGIALTPPARSLSGRMLLRLLAAGRRLRRRSGRFAAEQAQIERWLAAVERGARQAWTLGHEIALCGRLINAHGAAHTRGKMNLRLVVEHLAGDIDAASPADRTHPVALAASLERAAVIRAAREAALVDDAGRAFDEALRALGAPAHGTRTQPAPLAGRRPPTISAGAQPHGTDRK